MPTAIPAMTAVTMPLSGRTALLTSKSAKSTDKVKTFSRPSGTRRGKRRAWASMSPPRKPTGEVAQPFT